MPCKPGKQRKKYKDGGKVDNIPAMLTEGEYVIKKDSAQKLGYKNLEKMNATGDLPTGDLPTYDELPKYNAGGRVKKIKGYGCK